MGWHDGAPIAPPMLEGYACPEAKGGGGPDDPQRHDPPPPPKPAELPVNAIALGEATVAAVAVSATAAPVDIRVARDPREQQSFAFSATDAEGKALEGWYWLAEAPDGTRKDGKLDAGGRATFDFPKGRLTLKVTRQAPPPPPPPQPPVLPAAGEAGEGEASRRRTQPIESILERLKSSHVATKL
jgi:hypothetical protein